MIEMTGKKAVVSAYDMSSFVEMTLYLQMELTGTSGNLLGLQMDQAAQFFELKIETDGTLSITVPAGVGTGIWKFPITTGHHRIGVRFSFDINAAYTPVCFIDGVIQTPTSSTVASSPYYVAFRRLVVGGSRGSFAQQVDVSSWNFPGRISDIAICEQLHTSAVMGYYSNSALPKGAIRLAPGLLHYWPCDEVTDGQTGIQEIYSYPSADVNTLWTNKSLATYWESVRNDDGSRMEATETDENEEQQLAFANAAFIKPAGTEVMAIGVNMKSDAPTGQKTFTTSIKKGATWYPMPFPNGSFSAYTTDGKRKEVLFTRAMGWGDWSQSELNGIQVGLLTGTMGKDDFVTVNYMYVTAYCGVWTDQFRDLIGGNHLINRNAIGRAERFANYL